MYDGIINIYKEKGYTSHDVIAKLRGILKQKKIGHTGTLDPDAEGVLPVCLGKATKLCDLLTDKDKTYQTTLLLGQETDTQDISGSVFKSHPVLVTADQTKEAILSFQGEYAQIPPMYSAIKVNGKKLYELAREGKVIERAARNITIHNIIVENISLPRVTMTISCSKGTYIRTLCHDIGQKLGCGGCMAQLTRIKVGQFLLKDSLTLNEIEVLRDENQLSNYITTIDSMFPDYPRVFAAPGYDILVHNGNQLKFEHLIESNNLNLEYPIRVYDEHSQFMGIYKYNVDKKQFEPLKLFFGGN